MTSPRLWIAWLLVLVFGFAAPAQAMRAVAGLRTPLRAESHGCDYPINNTDPSGLDTTRGHWDPVKGTNGFVLRYETYSDKRAMEVFKNAAPGSLYSIEFLGHYDPKNRFQTSSWENTNNGLSEDGTWTVGKDSLQLTPDSLAAKGVELIVLNGCCTAGPSRNALRAAKDVANLPSNMTAADYQQTGVFPFANGVAQFLAGITVLGVEGLFNYSPLLGAERGQSFKAYRYEIMDTHNRGLDHTPGFHRPVPVDMRGVWHQWR